MEVIICHGFNSSRHAVWMNELGEIVQSAGFPIIRGNYGKTNLLNVRRRTDETAREIAAIATTNMAAVGHSNGFSAIHRAITEYGAPLRHIIGINPALSSDAWFPPWVERVDVLHASDDSAVEWGELYAKYNPLRLLGWESPWGNMGRVGYTGDNEAVHNHELGPVGHSGALAFSRRGRTGEAVCRLLNGDPPLDTPIFRG